MKDQVKPKHKRIKTNYNLKARKKLSCNTGTSTYLKLRLDDVLCSTRSAAHHYVCHDRITGQKCFQENAHVGIQDDTLGTRMQHKLISFSSFSTSRVLQEHRSQVRLRTEMDKTPGTR